MSINIENLLTRDLRDWIGRHLAEGDKDVLPGKFWIVPIDESDPAYSELCKIGINRIKSTKIIENYIHDSFVFIKLEDEDGDKICISHQESCLPYLEPSLNDQNFSLTDLHFLQKSYIVTKFDLPSNEKIPSTLVKSLPIFEDDVTIYFPRIHCFAINPNCYEDNFNILILKAILHVEQDKPFVKYFNDALLNLGYSIPEQDHGWIFDQLYFAIQSQKPKNFFLGIYKIFEFFFPIDSIFQLADKIDYLNSELLLLNHCRSSLNWNVNHQRGARSAISYASVSFAEICLEQIFERQSEEVSFKERAMEKLTKARHDLTHQDFRSVTITEKEILQTSKALLTLLVELFTNYKEKIHNRRGKYLRSPQKIA